MKKVKETIIHRLCKALTRGKESERLGWFTVKKHLRVEYLGGETVQRWLLTGDSQEKRGRRVRDYHIF